MNFAYIDILFFALIAGFLFIRFWGVLGTKHGEEKQRPPIDLGQRNDGDLHRTTQESAHINNTGKINKTIESALTRISLADSTFTPEHFISGVKMAFEMIVKAFAKGNLSTLEPLVSLEMLDTFEQAVNQREKKEHVVHTEIINIKQVDITDAQINKQKALITVLIEAEESRYVKDKSGNIISGDPEQIYTTRNKWTFEKDTHSQDPNWILIATKLEDS